MVTPTPITYSQLTVKIQAESQNLSQELLDEIPQIIRDAERVVNKDLELQINRVVVDSNFYAANDVLNGITLSTGMTAYIYLPLDCITVRIFEWFTPAGANPAIDGTDQYAGDSNQLQRISEDVMFLFAPNKSVTGLPQYFYVTGQQPVYGVGSPPDASNPSPITGVLCVGPTPDKNYAYRLHYITQQASLVDLGGAGYNYLSTWYPESLFFACMIRYAAFAKRADQLQYWTAIYEKALMGAKSEAMRSKGEAFKDLSPTSQPIITRSE